MTTEQETVETKPNLTPSEAFEELIELAPKNQRLWLKPGLALMRKENNSGPVVEARLQSRRDGRTNEQAVLTFDEKGLLSYSFRISSTLNGVLGIPSVILSDERKRDQLSNVDEQRNFARRIVPFVEWLRPIIEERKCILAAIPKGWVVDTQFSEALLEKIQAVALPVTADPKDSQGVDSAERIVANTHNRYGTKIFFVMLGDDGPLSGYSLSAVFSEDLDKDPITLREEWANAKSRDYIKAEMKCAAYMLVTGTTRIE
jgi:hypothetical protein